MLTSLRVKNLALVEDITVDFKPGLNMITGETGAGKSILVGALGLLLGGRADKSLIRSGVDTLSVEAVFQVTPPEPVQQVLEDLGLAEMEEGQLIIRRIVKSAGPTQAVVNDQSVTVQGLKRIGERLVDMHGPHDHQSLFDTSTQREMLDAFGHLQVQREKYETLYEEWLMWERRKKELDVAGHDIAAEIDLLSYKVKELEDASLSETEEEAVIQEHAVFGHAQRIAELANGASSALTEGEINAVDLLASALRSLDELQKLLPEAEAWRSELENASTGIREVSASLLNRLSEMDADPARLDWLDQRLNTYQQMKKKYGASVQSALEELERSRSRLADLESRDERMAACEKEQAAIMAKMLDVGGQLHSARVSVAQKMGQAITEELQALGFLRGRFMVEVLSTDPGPTGLDNVEFMFEPNVGEGLRSLRQIASSGEISRVMLATKAVLARHDRIPILVFDEIDANIGGETGGAVGQKLSAVAAHHQILCITHLPQVAMYGAAQFSVNKHVADGRTRTVVQELDGEARVEEIARMLGGRTLTELTLAHAREMLKGVGAA